MTRREILVHLLSMVAKRINHLEKFGGNTPETVSLELDKLTTCEDWLGQELLGINMTEYPEEYATEG